MEQYLGPFSREPRYIIELTASEMEFIGQAIHLFCGGYQSTQLTAKVLDDLVNQSHVVSRDPIAHKVYSSVLEAPDTAILLKPIFFTPFG
jgi:hypothetical protein